LYLVFLWNNGLREAVVTDVFLFLSTLFVQSAELILAACVYSVNTIMIIFLGLCITFNYRQHEFQQNRPKNNIVNHSHSFNFDYNSRSAVDLVILLSSIIQSLDSL